MDRYYFDLRDSGGDHRDEFGDTFDSIEEAERQALTLLYDNAPDQLQPRNCNITTCRVRDGRGLIIYEAKMVTMGKRFLNGIEARLLDTISAQLDPVTMQSEID